MHRCCIGSDMVYRLFHYIKHTAKGTSIVTQEFVILAVLKGKSREKGNELKFKLMPMSLIQSGLIDTADGKVLVSKILDLPPPHTFESPNRSNFSKNQNHHYQRYRLPFKFEGVDDVNKQTEIDQFWDGCANLVDSIATEVVYKFQDVYNWAVNWATLSETSSFSSLSSLPAITPTPSPRQSMHADHSKTFEFHVVEPVSNFAGRAQELEILKDAVNFDHEKEKLFLVTGCRGIGKSELIRRYICTDLKKVWNGNIIWLQSESRQVFIESLTRLGCKLQIEDDLKINDSTPTAAAQNVVTFLHKVLWKLENSFARLSLFVVDNLETRFDVLDSTLLYLKQECKSCVFTIITSSYLSIVDCDERLVLTGLDSEDILHLVTAELKRFQHLHLIESVMSICAKFQNHPLAIRQIISYLKRKMLLNPADNLNALFTYAVSDISRGDICSSTECEKDILVHKLDIVAYYYAYSISSLWELKTLQLQAIDAYVLETARLRTGPLALKFLKCASFLSVILNSECVNTRFLKFALNLSEGELSVILGLLNDHSLLASSKKEIKIHSIFVRSSYSLSHTYEKAGVLNVFLTAFKTCPWDMENEMKNGALENYNVFQIEFVQYAEAIFSYAQNVHELKDPLADAVPNFLYSMRNYEIHQRLVQKYVKYFSKQLNSNDHRILGLKLESTYINMRKGELSQAELDIQAIIKTIVSETFCKSENNESTLEECKSEDQILSESRDVQVLKFRALLDLAVVFYKQGYKFTAIETIDVMLGSLHTEILLHPATPWAKLKSVALHTKNLMEIDKQCI